MSLTRDDIGVWLINLRRNTDRRARMDEQLRRLGLDYILFRAIDGGSKEEQLGIRVDAQAYSRNMGAPLLPGKVGVYASHVAVWEALHASTHSAGLILEDDVVFHDGLCPSARHGACHGVELGLGPVLLRSCEAAGHPGALWPLSSECVCRAFHRQCGLNLIHSDVGSTAPARAVAPDPGA